MSRSCACFNGPPVNRTADKGKGRATSGTAFLICCAWPLTATTSATVARLPKRIIFRVVSIMMLCFSLAQAFTPGFTNSVFYFRPHLWGFLQSLQRSAKACFKASWKEAGSTFRPAFPSVNAWARERVFLAAWNRSPLSISAKMNLTDAQFNCKQASAWPGSIAQ